MQIPPLKWALCSLANDFYDDEHHPEIRPRSNITGSTTTSEMRSAFSLDHKKDKLSYSIRIQKMVTQGGILRSRIVYFFSII